MSASITAAAPAIRCIAAVEGPYYGHIYDAIIASADEDEKLEQSLTKHETLRNAHTEVCKKRLASDDIEASPNKKQNCGEEPA